MAAQETLLNGRYRLISQQGAGGMAVVYKAQDLALGRTVAVKILRPSLTSDTAFLQRFRQEARNVANLTHPNIVTLHDVGQDGNTYYMVMEYIDGQDLKKLIRANSPFAVERVLHIGIQICAGLGYAHRAGLVHADVKPQNILLTGNDTVKITDFGIAQALSHTQPQTKNAVVWGSPHYFSPEQASGDPPTPASDVYAIGIVLFEMLTGQLPYNGSDQTELALAHIREQVPHVRDFNLNVPANIDWVVNKVMSKDPSARYRTADQLGRILISYQKSLTTGASAPIPSLGNGQGSGPSAPQPSQAVPPASSGASPIAPIGSSAQYGGAQGIPPVQPQASQPSAPVAGPVTSGSVYSPPPQLNPLPPIQVNPASNVASPILTGNTPPEPARPIVQSAQPMSPFPSNSQQVGYGPQMSMPPQGNTGSGPAFTGYTGGYPASAPPTIDMVTIVLGVIAFLAVVGLIILWLVVWSTYSR